MLPQRYHPPSSKPFIPANTQYISIAQYCTTFESRTRLNDHLTKLRVPYASVPAIYRAFTNAYEAGWIRGQKSWKGRYREAKDEFFWDINGMLEIGVRKLEGKEVARVKMEGVGNDESAEKAENAEEIWATKVMRAEEMVRALGVEAVKWWRDCGEASVREGAFTLFAHIRRSITPTSRVVFKSTPGPTPLPQPAAHQQPPAPPAPPQPVVQNSGQPQPLPHAEQQAQPQIYQHAQPEVEPNPERHVPAQTQPQWKLPLQIPPPYQLLPPPQPQPPQPYLQPQIQPLPHPQSLQPHVQFQPQLQAARQLQPQSTAGGQERRQGGYTPATPTQTCAPRPPTPFLPDLPSSVTHPPPRYLASPIAILPAAPTISNLVQAGPSAQFHGQVQIKQQPEMAPYAPDPTPKRLCTNKNQAVDHTQENPLSLSHQTVKNIFDQAQALARLSAEATVKSVIDDKLRSLREELLTTISEEKDERKQAIAEEREEREKAVTKEREDRIGDLVKEREARLTAEAMLKVMLGQIKEERENAGRGDGYAVEAAQSASSRKRVR